MARSVHAFVRGSVPDFYRWLGEDGIAVPDLPAAWICGDCHLGNLGPIADNDGGVDIQIRDLDQTVIGNPAHDLLRLGLSLVTAARSSVLPGVSTGAMIDALVAGYQEGVQASDEPRQPDVVRTVMKRALGRHWSDLIDERADGRENCLPRNKHFWNLSRAERLAIDKVFARADVKRQAIALARPDVEAMRVIDAAYWRKGCSSLGTLRVAALLELSTSKGPHSLRALVDIKEAIGPIVPCSKAPSSDNAVRVVEGARHLSPNLGDRMIPATLLNRTVVIRELKPQDLKLEVEQFSTRQAERSAHYLGHVVGHAHGRQLGKADRKELQSAFAARRLGGDWFWDAVVALAGRSEAAYLAHCRLVQQAEKKS